MTTVGRRSIWHRAGPVAAVGVLWFAATTEGCSCTDETNPNQTTSSSSSSGSGGMGGAGGGGGTGGAADLSLTPAADVSSPFDATPDPDGLQIYLTALGPNGAGVFSVPADGSNLAPKELAAGDPFVSPFGIAIGTQGKQLYVADPGADTGNDLGAIFTLPVGGGTPGALAGTEDTVPRGLEVADENGSDVLYFSGVDKADGMPGVFSVSASGGTVKVIAKGDPFRDPSGIAVAKNGDLYIADTVASAERAADIIKVSGGVATVFVTGLRVGYPAGVALSQDDSALYVSGLDPQTLTDVVLIIDTASKSTKVFSDGISSFSESAGLHRAKNLNLFAWADSNAGPMGGRVFIVK